MFTLQLSTNLRRATLFSVFGFVLSLSSLAMLRADTPPRKSYDRPVDKYLETCFREYLSTQASQADYESTLRMKWATESIWLQKFLENPNTPLAIDEKTCTAMQIFKGRQGTPSHSLVNKTAELLNLSGTLDKLFLFLDIVGSRNDKEAILKRQAELKLLIKDKEMIYTLRSLNEEAQDSFIATLSFYSTVGNSPYIIYTRAQEHVTMFQGAPTEKVLGRGTSRVLKKVFPKFFEKKKKNPVVGFISRYFFVEADFFGLLYYVNRLSLLGRKLWNIWRVVGVRSSIKTIYSDSVSNNALLPTSFGSSAFPTRGLSWLSNNLPLLGVVLKMPLLLFHSISTFWFEFLAIEFIDHIELLFNACMNMHKTRIMLKNMTNELLDLLPKVYQSFVFVKKVYMILKDEENAELRKEFEAEYKVLHNFLVGKKSRKMRDVLRGINKKIKRREPMTTLEAWNPFSLLTSRLIYHYTKLEMMTTEQHERFKEAVFVAAQLLYKANIARAIAMSSQSALPISIPTIDNRNHKYASLSIKNGYTPLLITATARPIVKNDVHIGEEKSSLFVTGCNGGGKSTILMMAATNEILGPIGFMCAESASFTVPGKIYYFGNLEDSIAQGDSHFMVEASYMGDVYRYVKQSKYPVVIFADEPFSKTGGIESRALLTALCIRIADQNHVATAFMATTHLDNLPELANRLGRKDFDFSKVEFIEGKGITYKIIPGSVSEPLTNYILYEMNYEPDILLLQEEILSKDPQFKWKDKLRGYKPPSKVLTYLGRLLLLIMILLLLFGVAYLFKRKYHIIIHIKKRDS